MQNYFSGRYYKHQANGETLSIIIGKTKQEDFIQIITNHEVFQYPSLKGCYLTKHSISLELPDVCGRIQYGTFTPLHSHIMGPFCIFPMQCSHEIVSMNHSLKGNFTIKDRTISFDNGKGYIEGDKGRSFPKQYVWLHCNDFPSDFSIIFAIADIPFCGLSFTGCICNISYNKKEYRLATYNLVQIKKNQKNLIHLKQYNYDLIILISASKSYPLKAPISGKMKDIIYESTTSHIIVFFYHKGNLIFKGSSKGATFERRDA